MSQEQVSQGDESLSAELAGIGEAIARERDRNEQLIMNLNSHIDLKWLDSDPKSVDGRDIADWIGPLFTYQHVDSTAITAMNQTRVLAMRAAVGMAYLAPPSAERTLAIRALHLATMHFNSAVCMHGLKPSAYKPPEGWKEDSMKAGHDTEAGRSAEKTKANAAVERGMGSSGSQSHDGRGNPAPNPEEKTPPDGNFGG